MAIIGEGKPVASTIVTADRIWAADGQGIRHRAFVQFEDDTITTIGNQADLPHDGETVALGDVTLMPGLINCHCHLTLSSGPNLLADYFSTVSYTHLRAHETGR